LDSWGKQSVSYGDCGGIYQRWDESRPEGQKGYQGYAPRLNASRAPGLWQKLFVSFQAPRFDRYGNKTENACLVVDSLRTRYIHEIKAPGVESYNGNMPLLHNTAYYWLRH